MTQHNNYSDFVNFVTSDASKDDRVFLDRVAELSAQFEKRDQEDQVSRMLTAALGLTGESGEVADIVKKVFFHGHEYNEDIHMKLVKECGDIMWYLTNLMRALDVSLEDVMDANIQKLEQRYPNGFETFRSAERYAN